MARKIAVYTKIANLFVGAVVAASFAATSFAAPIDSDIDRQGRLSRGIGEPLRDGNDPASRAPYGSPFLLESGYSNVAKAGVAATDHDGTPGDYFTDLASACSTAYGDFLPILKDYYGPGKNLPACVAFLSTSKRCPANFSPVIKIRPSSLSTSISGVPIFACLPEQNATGSTGVSGIHNNFGANPGINADGYQAMFFTPATSAQNGAGFAPFVSISWDLYCYPTIKRSGNIDPAYIKPYPFERCNIAKADSVDTPLLVWDSGTVHGPVRAGIINTFGTFRRCPPHWTPYVKVDLPTITGSPGRPAPPAGRHLAISAFGVCVSGITNNTHSPDGYTVSYYSKAAAAQMTYNANSFRVEDPELQLLKNLHWTLICYPPNVPSYKMPPADEGCSDPNNILP